MNIVDVLGEYIRLDKAGANWKAACPFHNEKTPSFMVSEERQMWHCFGCQKSGDIFTFVMEMEGLDFREALKVLAEKAGVKLRGYDPKKAKEKDRTLEILELATKFWEYQLWNGPGKAKILGYLRERGLKDETIKEFRLGYAPNGWRHILTFLNKRGYMPQEIVRAGLAIRKTDNRQPTTRQATGEDLSIAGCYDRFRARVMFPIADYSGRIIGFSARVAPGADESQAKYINTPETEVYRKSYVLYGIDKARNDIKKEGATVLVEGNMDVIASHQAGIKNTVAVSGTALTSEQVRIMKRYAPRIKMLFDMDAAGQAAALKSLKLAHAEDMQVEIISLPFGKDAADATQKDSAGFKKAVMSSQNAIEYFLEKNLKDHDISRIENKRKVSEIMVDIISGVVNPVEKSHWIKKISEQLETTETALTDMLKKASLITRVSASDVFGREKNEKDRVRTKMEILTEELTAMMLVSSEVWKEAGKEFQKRSFSPEDSLLNFMLEKGEAVGFDFERLVGELSENEGLKSKAENLFFKKKYQQGLNNELEEIIVDDPKREFEICLGEIEKERLKSTLERLTNDLKTAEEKKDFGAADLLRREFNKIYKSLSELNKG